ncbi:hypothetical protein EAG_12060, partial [Camponotus floridanus]
KNKKALENTGKNDGNGKGKSVSQYHFDCAIMLSPELATVVGAEQMSQYEVLEKI